MRAHSFPTPVALERAYEATMPLLHPQRAQKPTNEQIRASILILHKERTLTLMSLFQSQLQSQIKTEKKTETILSISSLSFLFSGKEINAH